MNAMRENVRMLAALMGVDEEEAGERLDRTVLVTVAGDAASSAWAAEIGSLLVRTIGVTTHDDRRACVELVVGSTQPRSGLPRIYAAIDADAARVARDPVKVSAGRPHPLFAAVAACSAAAAVLVLAIEAEGLRKVELPLTVRFDQLGVEVSALDRGIDLDGCVMVGAGAVAHGFLRALRHVSPRGTLPIVDPKKVGPGNPNRCLYLTEKDVNRNKAEALADNAAPDFGALTLVPHVETFHDYVAREGVQRTAIVTVDSRRVRRSIQAEAPGEVLDASTTDITAVVVHSHRQPTEHACLSCIYRHVPDENARELAIADGLGIGLEMVKQNLISAEAAALIAGIHPGIEASDLKGKAYDTLFRELCAEQALRTPEGRQVLAPFAFVSALAGALLVIEMIRARVGAATTNYWQVDPWNPPVARLRRLRPKLDDCEFCSKPQVQAVLRQLWGGAK